MSDDNGAGGLVVIFAILWIGFAIAYPMTWGDSRIALRPFAADQRAFVLRLPDDSPLPLMIEQGSIVGLAIPAAPPSETPSADPGHSRQVATAQANVEPATSPLPLDRETFAGVHVIATRCQSPRDTKGCDAIVAVPAAKIERLLAAKRVWVWLERQ